jgi:prevent-host-death family protein
MNDIEITTMKSMTAADAKQSFGALLDAAQREPVTITKNGREVAVLLSKEDFERLEALEAAYWGRLAEEAEKEGFIGPEEGEKLLNRLLHAKD